MTRRAHPRGQRHAARLSGCLVRGQLVSAERNGHARHGIAADGRATCAGSATSARHLVHLRDGHGAASVERAALPVARDGRAALAATTAGNLGLKGLVALEVLTIGGLHDGARLPAEFNAAGPLHDGGGRGIRGEGFVVVHALNLTPSFELSTEIHKYMNSPALVRS